MGIVSLLYFHCSACQTVCSPPKIKKLERELPNPVKPPTTYVWMCARRRRLVHAAAESTGLEAESQDLVSICLVCHELPSEVTLRRVPFPYITLDTPNQTLQPSSVPGWLGGL